MNIGIQVSVEFSILSFLGCICRSGIVESKVSSKLNFMGKCQIVLHSGCSILYFHQQCMRVSIFPHPHSHKLFHVFWKIALQLCWSGIYLSFDSHVSPRRNEVAIIVNKRVRNAVLGWNLKNDRMISAHFQGRSFNITVIQIYALTSNPEEAEVEWFYEYLWELLELTPKKDVLFIIGDWNEK